MLTVENDKSWFARFEINATNIPYAVPHHGDGPILKPKKAGKVVQSVGLQSPRLYQIVFESINGVPVPNIVLLKASKLNANIGCRLSISLFDLESAAFIGRTWISPYAIPVIKTLKKDQDSESEDEATDEASSPKIDQIRAHLIGNKLNVKMKSQVFHDIENFDNGLVVEIGVKEPELYSGVWTPIYLFNKKRGGLEILSNNPEEGIEERTEEAKVSPLFSGSPRILPVIAGSLFESAAGYPGMAQLSGSSLQYYLIPRPDIKQRFTLWKENSFIGSGDSIPGIEKINVRGLQFKNSVRVSLTQVEISWLTNDQIRLKVPPSLEEFEEKMLENVRDRHYEEYPESISMDYEGNFTPARIIERRMLIGFHNSYEFIQAPTIINLQQNFEDNFDSDIGFPGNVRLENIQDPNISLIFNVEYKILISVKGSIGEEKEGLAKLVERFNSTPTDSSVYELEKLVVVGWGCLDLVKTHAGDNEKTVFLNCGTRPNPFSSLIFKSHEGLYIENEIEAFEKKVIALPLTLNFTLLEGDEAISGTKSIPFDQLSPTIPEFDSPVKNSPKTKLLEIDKLENQPLEKDEVELIVEVVSSRADGFSPLPPLPVTHYKSELSRIEKSRILQSGYETFRDEKGRIPELVKNSAARADLSKEMKDPLNDEIHIQFIALTLTDDFTDRSGGIFPDSVTFSFRFYTFPDMATERLKVYTGPLPPTHQKMSGSNRTSTTGGEEIWPAILYRFDQDGRPAYDQFSGISVQFNIDPCTRQSCANIRYGASSFPFYMDQKQLYIDIWDGDSLLLLGSSCIDLKFMMRQGRDAITCDNDVDIMWNEYIDEDNSHMRRSSSTSVTSRSVVPANDTRVLSTKLGSLHVKLTNIGRTSKKDDQNSKLLKLGSNNIVEDYQTNVKFRDECVHTVNQLSDMDSELKSFLQRSYEERIESKRAAMEKIDPAEPLTEEGKKLQAVYRLMKKDKIDAPFSWDISDYIKTGPDSFVYKQSRQERQKDLQTVEIHRERVKKKTVQQSLKDQLTTLFTIDASFGQGYFFEFVLHNPYSTDQNFEIQWEDPDLQIIEGEAEWSYHRRWNNIHHGVDKTTLTKMVHGRSEIFLHAKEKVAIPFLFQSFKTPCSDTGEFGKVPHTDARRSVITFLNSKKIPIAFLELLINPMSFYIDRSMQLFHCENELVRKKIRYPVSNTALVGTLENGVISIKHSPTYEKFLRCSNPDVVCSISSQTNESNYREISFKYRLGAAPDHSDVYFIFYHDSYCTNIHEIWRIKLHTIFRLDVNCIYGQTNTASMVLRGRTMTRQVTCNSNLPSIVAPAQKGPFTLAANFLTEIPISLKLESALDQQVITNIIDVETKTLVSSWYIIAHMTMPAITKVFNITLTKGVACNKRVSYTNPFLTQKYLMLKTDSPHLMQFKHNLIDLKGGETQYIGLKFAPCFNVSRTEILVFLNDEMDKVEECLSIDVTYH